MKNLDINALMEFLRSSGEQDESSSAKLEEADSDLSFSDLGFDSLALLNVVEHLKQAFDVDVPYDVAVTAQTPRSLLAILRLSLPDAA